MRKHRVIENPLEPLQSINNYRLITEQEESSFTKKIRNIKWTYWLNRPYTVFWATAFWKGVNQEYYERNGFKNLGANNHLYQFPDIYYDAEYEKKGVEYLHKYFKKHRMKDLSLKLERLHKHHLPLLQNLIENKNKSVAEKTYIFSELIRDYISFLWIIIPLEAYFHEKVKKEVPKYIKGDINKFVGDVSLPRKKNAYVRMQDELRKGTPIAKVQKMFGWMKSRDGFTDFYTIDELKEIKKSLTTAHTPEIKVPKQLIDLSEELKELTFFRTDRTDKFYEYFGVARPLLKEIAAYIGVSFKELAYYDANSIILGKPKKYDKVFSYAAIKNDYIIKNEPIISITEKHETKEANGRVAYIGKCKGIAKIVMHPTDVSKVKKGDILVAQMTLPSFISGMQKASAFVTDEGSITCHAAIVAREMRKPCIIGTKIATKIFKDGDLIEVDAEKGIVRKIN
jgi:phosphoenolpyruvate synthase/pyruvate phosphate dikinase